MMPLKETVIRRLKLSRYLFQLASQNARSDLDVASSASVNLLQDAIEIFLLAAIDHLNIQVGPRTDFPQYLDKINEKTGNELPFRRRLIDINKVRVLSKHDGISPNGQEVEGYLSDGRKFLEQACSKTLGTDFWSVSLVSLLEERESKNLLLEAEGFIEMGEYEASLVSVRKAFFVEFETFYDTQKDLDNPFGLFGSRAPYFARNKEYIEKNVATPFDYIVLDHAQVDADLTNEGIDHTTFWNVWRLTPQVYRHKDGDPWLNKHEPRKLESEGIKERANYALEAMVEVLLARQTNRRMTKWIDSRTNYVAKLRKDETTVYAKADKASAVVGKTKAGLTEIGVDYSTPALRGEGQFWSVTHFEKGGPILMGYIAEEDLKFD
jgi:hypothetical protein